MTKTDLILYLESLKKEAIDKVNGEASDKLKKMVTKYADNTKIDEFIKEAKVNLYRVKANVIKANEKIDIDHERWSHEITDDIDELMEVIENPESYIRRKFSVNQIEGYEPIQTITAQSVGEIVKNYKNLMMNVKGFKTAKQAILYLEGLGFIIHAESPTQANLAVPVDERFLICKGGM